MESRIAEHEVLSKRETQVLELITEGYTNKNIAGRLNVSGNTIAFHMKNIHRKLKVKTRHQAVIKAIVSGVITLK